MLARRIAVAALPLLSFFAVASTVGADEGMWTYDAFPSADVKAKYGFEPSPKFLEHLRLSSAKVGGCSASFVSKDGLVMTNHHCAHHCIQQISSPKKDYVADGFSAKTQADEVKCPDLEVVRLESMTDVSTRVQDKIKGLSGAAFADTRKAEVAAIEKECGASYTVRCDVVTLYDGGKYVLYKYRRWQDVRLVFAPELATAFFGGDPDNFEFPRYDLDVSFVRVYEDGEPAKLEHFFHFAKAPAKQGDLTFVSGHPYRTNRLRTVSQLESLRDVVLPRRLMYTEEWRGWLTQFRERDAESHRIGTSDLFGVENDIKRNRGRWAVLDDASFMSKRHYDEIALVAKVDADPARKAAYGDAWAEIAKAEKTYRAIHDEYVYLEGERRGVSGTWAFRSDLFAIARALVRGADELPKPNGKRLKEFSDGALPELQQDLFSDAPIYDDLEILDLTFSLTKMRENLGPDHPAVKKILGKDSPKALATRLVKGTKLKDVAPRKSLWKGGKKAIAASTDPMIAIVEAMDADARAVRTRYENEVEGPEAKNGEKIAKARFETLGTGVYPDATGTLRLSYGSIEGWKENGKTIAPMTTFGGAFARATGEDPFALPKSWLDAKGKIDMTTPLDFASSNDIIGGNSGSPVLNKNGEVVGLVFDGNFPSLGGDFGFDPSNNRSVSVSSAAIMHALDRIYGAQRIVEELKGK